MKTIAFTDDFAILIGVNKKESIEYKLNNYMNKIVSWCTNIGLQIATDKTEIINTVWYANTQSKKCKH